MPDFSGNSDTVLPVLRKLKLLDEKKKEIEAALEKVKQERTEIEEEAFKRMELESIQSIDMDGTLWFRKVSKFFAVKGEMKELANKWLKAHGFGDLFQETVNSRTLSSELKRSEEEDKTEIPEDLFNHTTINKIGRRKAK
ncbi:hypothetical protein KAR91_87715 [Candidatus Pacearchaeota archaeon]|nr:hypothetical protein [Candidatus Pacearchaeota archaeon]